MNPCNHFSDNFTIVPHHHDDSNCINSSLQSLTTKIDNHLNIFSISTKNSELYIQNVLSSVEKCCKNVTSAGVDNSGSNDLLLQKRKKQNHTQDGNTSEYASPHTTPITKEDLSTTMKPPQHIIKKAKLPQPERQINNKRESHAAKQDIAAISNYQWRHEHHRSKVQKSKQKESIARIENIVNGVNSIHCNDRCKKIAMFAEKLRKENE